MTNTDINTRTGWYNQSVTGGTTLEGGTSGFGVSEDAMGDWEGALRFPRSQGAGAMGRIVAVGKGIDIGRVGARVVCDPHIRDDNDTEGLETAGFLGSKHDGAFAQFTVVPSGNAVTVPDDCGPGLGLEVDRSVLGDPVDTWEAT